MEAMREMAFALGGVTEAPHLDRRAFRTKRKIFATLNAANGDLNLMFDAELQRHFVENFPHIFAPVPGGWGRMGATRCDLGAVTPDLLAMALKAAHQLALPQPKPRRATP